MSETDILSKLRALDEQRSLLLADARAERATLRQRLADLDALLGPSALDEPATKPRKARGEVTAAVRDALAEGITPDAKWAETVGYNAASVARAVRKAKAAA